MAYTNAQLVRLLVGDPGLPARDVSSGDGISVEFYLSAPPALAASAAVYLSGVLKTETSDYTLDDTTGRLVFAVAPPAASDNIVVTYYAAQIADGEIDEACRQYGLTPASTADIGEPPDAIRAAILLAESMAARYASVGNTTLGGGGSLGLGGVSDAWSRRADDLRAKLGRTSGLVAVSTIKVDGYSQDIKSTDVESTGQSPRRRYYGEEDRIP